MKVIPPLTINDARLTSSTAVEVAPAGWSSTDTYAIGDTRSVLVGPARLLTCYESLQNGNLNNVPSSSPTWWKDLGNTYPVYSDIVTYALADRVIDATAHRVYESLAAGNIGNALSDATKWVEVGPTNKWAAFDLLRSTKTVAASPLTVVLAPGQRIDALAALSLSATSIAITMTSGGEEVYSKTANLNQRFVDSYFDYCFLPFSALSSFAAFDLPPYSDGVVTVVITNEAGQVECGSLVVGSQEYLGDIQYGAESDVLNFSTVTRDFDGETSLMVQRRNVPRTIQQIFVQKGHLNRIRFVRDSLNSIPAVWAGLDDTEDEYFEPLLIVGFYKRFSINLAYPEHAVISLELEEI